LRCEATGEACAKAELEAAIITATAIEGRLENFMTVETDAGEYITPPH
jgi:hypothetical protein